MPPTYGMGTVIVRRWLSGLIHVCVCEFVYQKGKTECDSREANVKNRRKIDKNTDDTH